ncbi:hypothetical protein PCE1_004115 [Barthelona sp. PCE]
MGKVVVIGKYAGELLGLEPVETIEELCSDLFRKHGDATHILMSQDVHRNLQICALLMYSRVFVFCTNESDLDILQSLEMSVSDVSWGEYESQQYLYYMQTENHQTFCSPPVVRVASILNRNLPERRRAIFGTTNVESLWNDIDLHFPDVSCRIVGNAVINDGSIRAEVDELPKERQIGFLKKKDIQLFSKLKLLMKFVDDINVEDMPIINGWTGWFHSYPYRCRVTITDIEEAQGSFHFITVFMEEKCYVETFREHSTSNVVALSGKSSVCNGIILEKQM